MSDKLPVLGGDDFREYVAEIERLQNELDKSQQEAAQSDIALASLKGKHNKLLAGYAQAKEERADLALAVARGWLKELEEIGRLETDAKDKREQIEKLQTDIIRLERVNETLRLVADRAIKQRERAASKIAEAVERAPACPTCGPAVAALQAKVVDMQETIGRLLDEARTCWRCAHKWHADNEGAKCLHCDCTNTFVGAGG